MDPFKSHSEYAGEMIRAAVWVLTLRANNEGRLRATLPRAPKELPTNRHTIKEQDSDERARQRVVSISPSGESQSRSGGRRHEPIRSIWAVVWSSLSQRYPKATKGGARISPNHSRSPCNVVRYSLEKGIIERLADIPSRNRPTDGALWSLKSWCDEYRAEADRTMLEHSTIHSVHEAISPQRQFLVQYHSD